MKIRSSVIILILFLFAQNIKSQEIKNKSCINCIDTVTLLPYMGYITTNIKGQSIIVDTLCNYFENIATKQLKESAIFKIRYQPHINKLSTEEQDYIAETIHKFGKLDEKLFNNIPAGKNLLSIVDKFPGRYFGIYAYSGYEQANYMKQVGISVALGAASTLLTAGLFTVYTIPTNSFLKTELLIFDKDENRLIYYKSSSMNSSVTNEKKLKKYLSKTFYGYSGY